MGAAAHWETSNRPVRETLLGLLTNATGKKAAQLADSIIQLNPSGGRTRARAALMQMRLVQFTSLPLRGWCPGLSDLPKRQRRSAKSAWRSWNSWPLSRTTVLLLHEW